MRQLNKVIVSILLLLSATTSQVLADEKAVLIMADDSNNESIIRFDKVHKSITAAFAKALKAKKISVYDEEVTTQYIVKANTGRRTREELNYIISRVQKPHIDATVFLTVQETIEEGGMFSRIGVLMTAYVINPRNGMVLDTITHSPKAIKIPQRSINNRAKISARIARKANSWGAELAELVSFQKAN